MKSQVSFSRLLVSVLLICLSFCGLLLFQNTQQDKAANIFCLKNTGIHCDINLELVDTSMAREKGLSGRKGLASNEGMLFKFDTAGRQCIWMKDMRFSIDIIWLNSSNIITKLEENVSPNTYPRDFCQEDTLYVIELNAGVARAKGLSIGNKVDL